MRAISIGLLLALLSIVFTSSTFSASSARDETVRGRCLLKVKDKTYLSGPCRIDLWDDGFSIGTSETKRTSYFAYVNIDSSNRNAADGSWNADIAATHAHDPLGTLTRKGACWMNATATVCAWR